MKYKHRFVLTFLVLGLSFATAFSQPARLMQYDGTLNTADGTPFDGVTDINFSIYRTPMADVALWSESHDSVRVQNGDYSILLGSKTPLKLSFFEYYLEVESAVGTQPRIQITGPGYSFRISFLAMAYAIVWIAIFVYLMSITRRQKRVIAELQALTHSQ